MINADIKLTSKFQTNNLGENVISWTANISKNARIGIKKIMVIFHPSKQHNMSIPSRQRLFETFSEVILKFVCMLSPVLFPAR